MSVSTNGQICYGIVFEEDFEFPWSSYDNDIEDWWRVVNGYKPPFELFTADGNYVYEYGDVPPAQSKISEYVDHRRDWDKDHPIPIELVNYCSEDCPMYIIAVPSTCIYCHCGYPESLNPFDLKASEEEKAGLLEFCKKYGIETDESPKWYLSSYWG